MTRFYILPRFFCSFLILALFRCKLLSVLSLSHTMVADPHHFNADPDPAFRFNADPDPAVHFKADPDPAHFH
jgi:hypothetical protein